MSQYEILKWDVIKTCDNIKRPIIYFKPDINFIPRNIININIFKSSLYDGNNLTGIVDTNYNIYSCDKNTYNIVLNNTKWINKPQNNGFFVVNENPIHDFTKNIKIYHEIYPKIKHKKQYIKNHSDSIQNLIFPTSTLTTILTTPETTPDEITPDETTINETNEKKQTFEKTQNDSKIKEEKASKQTATIAVKDTENTEDMEDTEDTKDEEEVVRKQPSTIARSEGKEAESYKNNIKYVKENFENGNKNLTNKSLQSGLIILVIILLIGIICMCCCYKKDKKR